MRSWLRCITAAGVLAATVLAGDPLVVRAKGYVAADGTLVRDATLVIDGAKISGVGAEAAKDVQGVVDEYPEAVLMPGLIDLGAQLSAVAQLGEIATPVQPAASAADAFDRYSRQLRAALEAGVTSFLLAPDDSNLIGGRAVLVSTGTGDGRGILQSGPLKISLSPTAWLAGYEPSSRSGALALLRRTLDAARGPDGEVTPAFTGLFDGETLAMVTAPTAADMLTVSELAQRYSLSVIVQHTDDAREIADVAKDFRGVVVGPLGLAAGPRAAEAAARFAAAGAKVAIAGGLPFADADGLRIGAAVAARAGLDAALARRAIATVPAELLGIEATRGVLDVGRVADVVVFSGDPLDLRSRVLAVYLDGERVYRAAASADGGN